MHVMTGYSSYFLLLATPPDFLVTIFYSNNRNNPLALLNDSMLYFSSVRCDTIISSLVTLKKTAQIREGLCISSEQTNTSEGDKLRLASRSP